MSEKKSIHPIIPIIVIPIVGFVLLNLSFLLAAGVRVGIHLLINAIIDNPPKWLPFISHIITFTFLITLSFFVIRSKRINDLIKATFFVVPTAVILVYIGIFLSNFPVFLYLLSGIVVLGISYYLYKFNKSWMYFYSLILVSFTLLIMMIFGIDI